MKHPTYIQTLAGVMGLLGLMVQLSCAMPLPIQNGVLTGPLNANGQAITHVAGVTFTDGTTLSTAVKANTNAFSGTVTNLAPPTVAYSTNTFIQVSGSGLAAVNDNTYEINASFGSAYGYPVYLNASQTEQISFWEAAPFGLQAGQSGWIIATNGYDQYGNTPVYFLSEGVVASPDLATNWLSVLADSGGNLIPNPLNNPPPALVAVQTISTNWVRHFNLATFTNGVCVTNIRGSITMNPNRHQGGSFGTATNLTGAATNQVNALALAQAQAALGALAPTDVPVNTVVSAGDGLTVVSNSAAGVQTYTVSGINSNTLLGMAGAVIAGSNYLTSASSNNFAGRLNSGQVDGLGTVASLSSNTVLGMAGAAIAGSNYLTNVSSNLVSTAPIMLIPALDGTGTNLWMNCTNFGADVFFEYQASNNVLLNVTNFYPGSMWSLAIFNTNKAANVTIYMPTNWTSFNTTNGLSVLGGDYFFVISSNHLARVAWRTNYVGQEVSWTLYQP